MGAFGNPDLGANPTVYTFVLVCSFLDMVTLVFANFRLHRRMLSHARRKHEARRKKSLAARQAKREAKSAARLEAEAARDARRSSASALASGDLRGEKKWSLTRRALSNAQNTLGIEQEHGEPVGTVAVRVMRAKSLVAADRAKKGKAGASDPYVVVQSTNGAKGKTSVKRRPIPNPSSAPNPIPVPGL